MIIFSNLKIIYMKDFIPKRQLPKLQLLILTEMNWLLSF